MSKGWRGAVRRGLRQGSALALLAGLLACNDTTRLHVLPPPAPPPVPVAVTPDTPAPQTPVPQTPDAEAPVPETPVPETPRPDAPSACPANPPQAAARPPSADGRVYAGVAPVALAVADLDGDGAPDVVVAAEGRGYESEDVVRTGGLTVLHNDGRGQLTTRPLPVSLRRPWSLAVGDVVGGAEPDLVVGTHDGTVRLEGLGAARFAPPQLASSIGPSPTLQMGPLAGNARPDLLVLVAVRWVSPSFYLLRNAGDGRFEHVELQLRTDSGVEPLGDGEGAVAADFDGDGAADLAVARNGHLEVHLRVSESELRPTWSQDVPWVTKLHTGDFDGDGQVDVLLQGTSYVQVMLGDGRGGLRDGGFTELGLFVKAAVVADVNGDGRSDVVLAHDLQDQVTVLHAQEGGALHQVAQVRVGRNPSALAVADLDRDGQLELLVAEADDNMVRVLPVPRAGREEPAPAGCPLRLVDPGTCTPALSELLRFELGAGMTVAAGDFDGDCDTDLVVARFRTSLRLLRNLGGGHFAAEDHLLGAFVGDLATGDFDGDGDLDLVAPFHGGDDLEAARLTVLRNEGGGRAFRPTTVLEDSLQGYAVSVQATDFDGDGRMDVAAVWGNRPRPIAMRYLQGGAGRFRSQRVPDYSQDANGPQANSFGSTTLSFNLDLTGADGLSRGGQGFGTYLFGAWGADFDDDGRLDILDVVSSGGFMLWPGDGRGSLRAPHSCSLAPDLDTAWLEPHALNGDGRTDLLAFTEGFHTLVPLLAQGGGRFVRGAPLTLDALTPWVLPVDLMGDATPELVVPHSSTGALVILGQGCARR